MQLYIYRIVRYLIEEKRQYYFACVAKNKEKLFCHDLEYLITTYEIFMYELLKEDYRRCARDKI